MGSFCYLCFTFNFIVLSCLFFSALLSSAEKMVTSFLSCVMFPLCFCYFPIWFLVSDVVLVLECMIPDLRLFLYFDIRLTVSTVEFDKR